MSEMDENYSDLDLDFVATGELNFLDTDTSLTSQGRKGQEPDEVQFVPGSEEYKKARKRRQNRESAARNRARKKLDFFQLDREIDKLSQENRRLMLENQSLRTENEILKKELSFYLSVVEKPPAPSKQPPLSLLTTTLLASLMCICVFFNNEQSSAVLGEGPRRLLSVTEVAGDSLTKAVAIVAVWVGAVWVWRLWTDKGGKSKVFI